MKTLNRAFENEDIHEWSFSLPDALKNIHPSNYVGVDLDGTQAYYDTWKGLEHIGEPIPRMVAYVKYLLENNIKVVHFTARVATNDQAKLNRAKEAIDAWSQRVYGQALPVTAIKDKNMVLYYDDKAYNVVLNEGTWQTH